MEQYLIVLPVDLRQTDRHGQIICKNNSDNWIHLRYILDIVDDLAWLSGDRR